MKKIVLFFAFVFYILCFTNVRAQLANIDFEQGSPVNWYNAAYGFIGCGTGTPNTMPNLGFNYTAMDATSDEHGFCNTNYIDPSVTTFSLMCPGPLGGNYAMRLGDVIDDCGAAQMSYSFSVNMSTTDLALYYAVVLFDGHPVKDAPKFIYELYDIGFGTLIFGDTITAINASTDTTFHAADINVPGLYYTKWSKTCFNLMPYIGRQVRLTLIASDCDSGNHRGYAYVDCLMNSCSGTSSIIEANNLSSSVSVYPNPASNCVNLFLKSLQSDEFEITLCDIQGNTILKDNFASALGQINKTYKTENLPRGIYFVYIKTKQQGSIQKKVIIN